MEKFKRFWHVAVLIQGVWAVPLNAQEVSAPGYPKGIQGDPAPVQNSPKDMLDAAINRQGNIKTHLQQINGMIDVASSSKSKEAVIRVLLEAKRKDEHALKVNAGVIRRLQLLVPNAPAAKPLPNDVEYLSLPPVDLTPHPASWYQPSDLNMHLVYQNPKALEASEIAMKAVQRRDRAAKESADDTAREKFATEMKRLRKENDLKDDEGLKERGAKDPLFQQKMDRVRQELVMEEKHSLQAAHEAAIEGEWQPVRDILADTTSAH